MFSWYPLKVTAVENNYHRVGSLFEQKSVDGGMCSQQHSLIVIVQVFKVLPTWISFFVESLHGGLCYDGDLRTTMSPHITLLPTRRLTSIVLVYCAVTPLYCYSIALFLYGTVPALRSPRTIALLHYTALLLPNFDECSIPVVHGPRSTE
jgi:hypothetical protein